MNRLNFIGIIYGKEFTMSGYMENIRTLVTVYGLRILIGIVLFFIGRYISKFISEKVAAHMDKRGVNQTLTRFVRQIMYVSLLICVLIAVLQFVGIPTAQFMVVLGSAGLAIGLAMRDTLSNFASGILLTTLRPFQIGDYVEAGGKGGTVVEIQLLNTILNTPDNVRIVVPNGTILSRDISNYTVNGKRRMVLNVGVSYDDDLQKATQVLMDLVKSDDRVLEDPAPAVVVTGFGDSSIDIAVRAWALNADYWNAYFDLNKKIKTTLDENGITIPFPQRVVYMQNQQN